MSEKKSGNRKPLHLETGQTWYPENPEKHGRKITFTSKDPPGPKIREIIDRFNVIGYLTVDKEGNPVPADYTFTENATSWNSWIMIEGFRAWIRKNKASMQNT